jgi:hypothetical protein
MKPEFSTFLKSEMPEPLAAFSIWASWLTTTAAPSPRDSLTLALALGNRDESDEANPDRKKANDILALADFMYFNAYNIIPAAQKCS